MDSTKTHTAVPEQNSKLNIYVYIQYTVTGADPEVLLTDALNLNLALVGGPGESSPGKF